MKKIKTDKNEFKKLIDEKVEKLEIKNNDVLVVHNVNKEFAEWLYGALESKDIHCLVICIADNLKALEVMTEKQMNDHGWYKRSLSLETIQETRLVIRKLIEYSLDLRHNLNIIGSDEDLTNYIVNYLNPSKENYQLIFNIISEELNKRLLEYKSKLKWRNK
jgi:hypothetical protein